MHTKFRTVVTSRIEREEKGTKEGVIENFHTNWAVLFLKLSGGFTVICWIILQFCTPEMFYERINK